MCQILGVTEVTYFGWCKDYGGMKADQAKRFEQIKQENARLNCLLAQGQLDKVILREAAQGNF